MQPALFTAGIPVLFTTLPLRSELQQALEQIGFTETTPIQEAALPVLLDGRDVTGQAKTGSGKTAAFGLALLNGIDEHLLATQALVLCPTRELADQVAAELRRLAQRMKNVQVLSVCGGRPDRDQAKALKRGCQVVVGTPGRLGKHLRKRCMDLRALRVLVLDEADRMLDMGFMDQVMEIVQPCPRERQTLLFSATFPEPIHAWSSKLQRDALFISVETQVAQEQLRQLVYEGAKGQRHEIVAKLLATYQPTTALVFCETRNACVKLAAFLAGRGAETRALHGQLEQRERDDVLLQFVNGSIGVLVATNVAARGLDVPSLPLVILAEPSADPESHLHRIGRTARAGVDGVALSVVTTAEDRKCLQRIEALMGHKIARGEPLTGTGGLEFLTPPNRTLLILAGRKDKLRKGDVLGCLVKDGGIPPECIGRIDLMPRACAVAVHRSHARQALNHLKQGRIKNKRVRSLLL